MQLVARSGSPMEVGQILEESKRHHILPMDLLLGILQPLLVEIGKLWASGQATVAMEHRFSDLVGELLAHVRKDFKQDPKPESPKLLLLTAEGNYHVLGLKMAEPFFVANGVPTITVVPGLPIEEVLDLLDRHQPWAVGFSVALESQMVQVHQVAERVRQLPGPPRHILVGGPVVRMGLELDPSLGILACRQLSDVLPLFQEQPPEGTSLNPRNPNAHGNQADLAPKRKNLPKKVFLVDDDQDVGFLMTRVLKKGGVRQVRTFTGGEAVIQHLRSGECPDLVILDQNMPGINGVQTLELIRHLHPELPILISSGQSGLDEWVEFRRPRVGVISKPFTMKEILDKFAQFGHETIPGR
jgi:CheY-like chemotaxis protein